MGRLSPSTTRKLLLSATLLQESALGFAAGAVGGLANSFVVWVFGVLGITALFGVAIAPEWTLSWLYPRIVWGGLWGLIVPYTPSLVGPVIRSGLLVGLAPTFVQLFVVFPLKTQQGLLGLGLGTLTPLFVFLFNVTWAIATVSLYRLLTFSDAWQFRR